jgi:hypothetical protein
MESPAAEEEAAPEQPLASEQQQPGGVMTDAEFGRAVADATGEAKPHFRQLLSWGMNGAQLATVLRTVLTDTVWPSELVQCSVLFAIAHGLGRDLDCGMSRQLQQEFSEQHDKLDAQQWRVSEVEALELLSTQMQWVTPLLEKLLHRGTKVELVTLLYHCIMRVTFPIGYDRQQVVRNLAAAVGKMPQHKVYRDLQSNYACQGRLPWW